MHVSLICEAIGTGLFTFMVIASDANNLADSLSLFTILLIFGGVTGGNFNPAVTIGSYVYEGHYKDCTGTRTTFWVILAQFTGSLLGLALGAFALTQYNEDDGQLFIPEDRVPVLTPKDPYF